jgi:hypothetical protein
LNSPSSEKPILTLLSVVATKSLSHRTYYNSVVNFFPKSLR